MRQQSGLSHAVDSVPPFRFVARESWEITSREQWQARRGKDVTASIAANLFEGVNPYGDGVADVVAHLNGTAKRRQTPSMRAGILIEHCFPAALAEERPEWQLVKATSYHRLPEHRLGCTPDFWIGDDGLLQAKTCSERVWEDWRGKPPLGYTIQTLIEMMVTGRSWGILGIIVRSDLLPLHLFEMNRNPAAEAKILDAVAGFWQRYDAGEFPPPAPSEELAAMLDDGSHIDLSDDPRLPEWLAHRAELVETRSDCERKIKQYDYELKQRLGKASTAYLPGWDISWKSQHRKEFTVAAQDIRVLRVKRTKESEDEIG